MSLRRVWITVVAPLLTVTDRVDFTQDGGVNPTGSNPSAKVGVLLICQWGRSGKPPSDQATAGSQKKIVGISTRLLHELGIVAVFGFQFVKYKFYRHLRRVS